MVVHRHLSLSIRHPMHRWRKGEQDLRLRVFQTTIFLVPPRSFQEQSVREHSIRWACMHGLGLLISHLEVKDHIVDGNRILARVVLRRASQKRLQKTQSFPRSAQRSTTRTSKNKERHYLCEEKARDPEDCRRAIDQPVSKECQPILLVCNITRQRLQRRITPSFP